MTIKQRLLITSFAMLTVLLILGASAVDIAIEAIFDPDSGSASEPYFFLHTIDKVVKISKKFERRNSEEYLEEAAAKFNKKYSKSGLMLAVFKDNTLLTNSAFPIPDDLKTLAFIADNEGLLSTGHKAVFVEKKGAYMLALFNPIFDFRADEFDDKPEVIITITLLTIIIIIFIIVAYSVALSTFIFRHIAKSLNTLKSGVGQIRDGELDCRINYKAKDEFAPVCKAFNEMAQKLLDSVKTKQKDEDSRQQLIAGISHDLRTPLTSIKAYAESLAGNIADSAAKRDKYINTIKMKADDMEKLIQQLFLFSKLDTAEFPMNLETIDINKELALIIDSLKDEFEKTGIEIIFNAEETEMFVQLDVIQFRNVVYNIIDNSRKYKTAEHASVIISAKAADSKVLITIADNGAGVPSESLEKIFDVFYRCDSARSTPSQGSGLGLAITFKIMKQLGGSVWAENNADGGLSIIISLPLVRGKS